MRVENKEVAAIFGEMADLLHIQGGNRYRIRAFRRSSRIIENLPEPVNVMIRFGTFQKVPNIGPGTVHRVKQILRTGTCDDHARLKAELPAGLRDLLEVRGVGAKTARALYQNLRIGSIDELEQAALAGKIETIPRMGRGTTERILKGIAAWRKRVGRMPYVEARRTGRHLVETLQEMPQVQRILLAGSVRRGKPNSKDLDILVGADDRLPVASRFITLPQVAEVLVQGEGRAQVRLHNRLICDLRVLPPENFGAGMHYFTGSKLHNIAIRVRGNRFKLKVSDKGIFRRADEYRLIPGETEEEIFAAVGLPWIAPELRENLGEVEAAAAGKLPKLITAADLKGDLHMHTIASDGVGTAMDMVQAAMRLGHEYIAITDHTQSCEVANGQDEARLAAQLRHIRDLQEKVDGIRIFAGVEVDILADGTLDIEHDLLRQLDWVVASVHASFEQPASEMTARLIRAMETGLVDCIGHPTNRRLGHREGSPLDMEKLLHAARKLDVALEVNGNPYRMDLEDVKCRMAREAGVPLCINTDAHAPDHLPFQEYGIVTARRGWIEPRHVLNTRSADVIAERRRDRFRKRGLQVSMHVTEPEPAVEVVPAAEENLASLVDALRQRPVPAEVRDRVQRWMESGRDTTMERALTEINDNPMQAAFALLLE